MTHLCWAQFLVTWVPFERWRKTLGWREPANGRPDRAVEATGLAADVEWAATRLPFPTKCLPRAMALSWMLRRRAIDHALVIAVRPRQMRLATDALHAWVEHRGKRILGDLPGPWIESLRLGA